MKKRLLALLLCLVMVIGLVPTVFAADGRVAMRSDARGDALRCQLALPHGVYAVVVATTSGHRVTKIVL